MLTSDACYFGYRSQIFTFKNKHDYTIKLDVDEADDDGVQDCFILFSWFLFLLKKPIEALTNLVSKTSLSGFKRVYNT